MLRVQQWEGGVTEPEENSIVGPYSEPPGRVPIAGAAARELREALLRKAKERGTLLPRSSRAAGPPPSRARA